MTPTTWAKLRRDSNFFSNVLVYWEKFSRPLSLKDGQMADPTPINAVTVIRPSGGTVMPLQVCTVDRATGRTLLGSPRIIRTVDEELEMIRFHFFFLTTQWANIRTTVVIENNLGLGTAYIAQYVASLPIKAHLYNESMHKPGVQRRRDDPGDICEYAKAMIGRLP